MSEFYKDWNASKSQNNNGAVPFYRPIDLTPEEQAQARKNIGVIGSPDITNLENKVDELEGDVASLSGTVGTVSAQFNTLSGNVDEALTSANAALAGVGAFSADLYTVSAKADTNSANIGSLSAQVQTNVTDIAAISGKNTVQDNKIVELSSSVAGLTNSAVYHEAKIQNLETDWSSYSADLRNDFNTFSATEDAVIMAATAAIPGQITAEVSGQLSGKQDKLTTANAGINISISTAGVIDVKNNGCSAPGGYGIAIGYYTSANGTNSFSHGANSKANGLCSNAEGQATYANGTYSHAEGYNTSAKGSWSHSEGYETDARGIFAHAEGAFTVASDRAHAEGRSTSALNNYAHAEGDNTIAAGQYSHAEGQVTSANGIYSHTEGRNTVTSAQGSHAEGYQTSAFGENSHAEGRYTVTDTNAQHVEGQYNAPATGALHVIGNGTSTANRSNIIETYTSGVNVNGNLIASGYNLNKAAEAMNDFMFDTATPTGYQAVLKLNTNDWQITNTAYSEYTKKYDRVFVGDIRNPTVGNAQLCGIKNLTNGPVGIVEWKGDISRACWGSTTANNRNNVSSWPSTIPTDIPNVVRLFSENNYLTSVDQIPTNFIEATSGKNKSRCFQRSLNLRGDVTPYIAAFSAEPTDNTYAMFGGCRLVDNYATLSTAYPNFFADPS